MTVIATVRCDGHRNGMPCRGAFPTRHADRTRARVQAMHEGWRLHWPPGVPHDREHLMDLCPSPNHTEEAP
jgi:hypothetical protein